MICAYVYLTILLINYITGIVTGNMTHKPAIAVITRVVIYLNWGRPCTLWDSPDDVVKHLKRRVKYSFQSIGSYCTHVEIKLARRCGTVIQYLAAIKHVSTVMCNINYFVLIDYVCRLQNGLFFTEEKDITQSSCLVLQMLYLHQLNSTRRKKKNPE